MLARINAENLQALLPTPIAAPAPAVAAGTDLVAPSAPKVPAAPAPLAIPTAKSAAAVGFLRAAVAVPCAAGCNELGAGERRGWW